MSVLSKPYFHDEAAAFAHVEAILWENGPVCPHCGGVERIYVLKNVRSKPSKKSPEGVIRHGLKKCGQCSKQFTVRIGTIFEESHIELHKWLQAIHLMCSSKKGVSAHQLHRTLEITYKSAWFLAHRIREAMRAGELAPMGGNGKVVEYGEIKVGDQKVIRIDPFLASRAERVLADIKRQDAEPFSFEGSAYGSFDGILRAVDFQPAMKRGIIRLSAGDVAVQCNITGVPIEEISAALERRAVFYGLAHYDGKKGLPRLVDIQRIELVPSGSGLARWGGAFDINEADEGGLW